MKLFSYILGGIKARINNLYWRNRINLGKRSTIHKPIRISCGGGQITVGQNVTVKHGCWIECCALTDNPNPEIVIGDGCNIGNFNEIYSTSKIIIEDNVLTADRVYISDNLHTYSNPDKPIINQPILQNRTVTIGEGSWIGINSCIMGATIGKHCTIGANSVVTTDIPAYCVAVGSPAYIIKRFDFDRKRWVKTDKYGNFIN